VALALFLGTVAGGLQPRAARPALEPPALIGWLYVAEGTVDRGVPNSENAVSGFAALADGSLALLPGSPWGTGGRGPAGPAFVAPQRAAVSADRRHLFVPNRDTNNLAVFSIGPDGTLTPLPDSPFPTGGTKPEGVAVSPDGRFLFVAHTGERAI